MGFCLFGHSGRLNGSAVRGVPRNEVRHALRTPGADRRFPAWFLSRIQAVRTEKTAVLAGGSLYFCRKMCYHTHRRQAFCGNRTGKTSGFCIPLPSQPTPRQGTIMLIISGLLATSPVTTHTPQGDNSRDLEDHYTVQGVTTHTPQGDNSPCDDVFYIHNQFPGHNPHPARGQ